VCIPDYFHACDGVPSGISEGLHRMNSQPEWHTYLHTFVLDKSRGQSWLEPYKHPHLSLTLCLCTCSTRAFLRVHTCNTNTHARLHIHLLCKDLPPKSSNYEPDFPKPLVCRTKASVGMPNQGVSSQHDCQQARNVKEHACTRSE
jgi:hypothetical protein